MTITQSTDSTPSPPAARPTPSFRAGTWTPVSFDAYTKSENWDEALKQHGFSLWTSTDGMTDESADLIPLSLRVWERSEHPRFLIEVNTIDNFDSVFAHDLPDAMDLLARWAPAIQAFALAGLVTDANRTGNGNGGQDTLIGLARSALGQNG
ncbi:hypothetical protein ACFCWY_20065 [Streptomyces sp. NPDC056362]|uniref:hypothetical protein n=1 Tax=unclassified Streptomyces TaxID=2593676 RepID=UPI0035DCA1CD